MWIIRTKNPVHDLPDQSLHKSCNLQLLPNLHPCDHHYNQSSLQPPLPEHDSHPVFTIEEGARNIPQGSLHKDSEPLYQEIGERLKYSRDGGESVRDMNYANISDKLCTKRFNCKAKEEYNMKTYDKPKMKTKHKIVYGVITAKEVAKYRPCTPDIIIRP